MASPIGHALVGIGLAALAVPVTGLSPTPMLWLGAVIASGLPDLDIFGTAFGLTRRQTHRGPTHSLLVLGLLAFATLGISSCLEGAVCFEHIVIWSVVLLSHPIVDLLATGPQAARHGFGLPLFWPVWPRRWYLRRPPVRPPSLEHYGTRAIWRLLLPEFCTLGPVCVGLILLGRAL